jgi:lysophospholipid acyltransferase
MIPYNEDCIFLLHKDQKYYKITHIPGVVEYFSYIFFFGAGLCGPFNDFRDFCDFIEKKGVYQRIPNTTNAGLFSFLQAIVCLACTILILPNYSVDFVLNENWKKQSALSRLLYLNLCPFIIRSRYYTGWKLAQSSIDFAGFSFNGYENNDRTRPRFDRIETSLISAEVYGDFHHFTESWNRSIHLWLKYNVHERLLQKSKDRKSSWPANGEETILNLYEIVIMLFLIFSATFIVSALWHGFYPTYYVVAIYFILVSQLSKHLFKLQRNVSWLKESLTYKIVTG